MEVVDTRCPEALMWISYVGSIYVMLPSWDLSHLVNKVLPEVIWKGVVATWRRVPFAYVCWITTSIPVIVSLLVTLRKFQEPPVYRIRASNTRFVTPLNPINFCQWPLSRLITVSNQDCFHYLLMTEAVVQRCSIKKVFLKMSQNSSENTCFRVSF